MGVFENISTTFSRIWPACVVYEHAAIWLPLSRSISTICFFSATDIQIFPDVDLKQSFKEAA
jgi:hypothetical protein